MLPSKAARTFFVTDRRMLKHRCEWDQTHICRPEKLSAILELLEKEGVLSECVKLDSAECQLDDLQLVHSADYIARIQAASALPTLDDMEIFCAQHEDIYINAHSWESALLSAGCALKAMQAVLDSRNDAVCNAFAAIRPPGHHASAETPCGFCLFNNVAVCAKKARQMGTERVLIIDWDIHAGQGTQYCVDDDPGILLVSAHRYEQGHFWPELSESAIVNRYRNTINVPLNAVGYGDAEYASFMHLVVLPLVLDWRPQLILVSAGFDAALGDPQGEMQVTPACFGYMTGLLAQLEIPLCLLLEGGYFMPSVAQSSLQCVHALLQKAPPVSDFCRTPRPAPAHLRTLFSVQLAHSAKFPLFANCVRALNRLRMQRTGSEEAAIQLPIGEYNGHRQLLLPSQTRGVYPSRETTVEAEFSRRLSELAETYKHSGASKTPREELDIRVAGQGKVLSIGGREFPVAGPEHLLAVYFCTLLPLAFHRYTVRIDNVPLPLAGRQLARLAAQFAGAKPNDGTKLEQTLALLLDAFPDLDAFLMF